VSRRQGIVGNSGGDVVVVELMPEWWCCIKSRCACHRKGTVHATARKNVLRQGYISCIRVIGLMLLTYGDSDQSLRRFSRGLSTQ
jgi:hypothetical protein